MGMQTIRNFFLVKLEEGRGDQHSLVFLKYILAYMEEGSIKPPKGGFLVGSFTKKQ